MSQRKKIWATVRIYLIILLLIQSTIAISFIAASFFAKIDYKGRKIIGTKAEIDGDNMLAGTWILPLADLKTEIEINGPLAELQLSPTSTAGGNKKAFSGYLTLNGFTQPVSGIIDLSEKNATVKFKIDAAKFGIEMPEETVNLGVILDI